LTETAAPLTPESLVGLQTFQRALAIGYTGVIRRELVGAFFKVRTSARDVVWSGRK